MSAALSQPTLAAQSSPSFCTTFQSFQFSDIETVVFMMVFRSGPPSYERMDSSSDRHHSLCLSRYHK